MKLKGRRLRQIDEDFDLLFELGVHFKGGGGSSAPAETTQTSVTEPPEYVKPYSEEALRVASNLSSVPYTPYSGERIAGLTPEHEQGLDMTYQRALQGSPMLNSANQHMANVFNDTYMNQGMDLASQKSPYAGENMYMQGMINQAQKGITDNYLNTINPQLQAMDRASGAFGNTGVQQTRDTAQEQLLKQLSNTENQYRFQDYSTQQGLEEQRKANMLNMYGAERANQMGSMEFAPQLAEQDYIDAQNMLGVGDIRRNADQQYLDFDYDQWTQQQNWPYQQLDVLQRAIANSMGGYTSNVTSAPDAYASNNTAQMIGTGLAGYGAIQGLLG